MIIEVIRSNLSTAIRHAHALLQILDAHLGSLYALCARGEAAPSSPASRNVELQVGEILCLKRRDGVRSITVLRGSVWLTGTPSAGDVLLREGERFTLKHDWPFVMQGMDGWTSVLLALEGAPASSAHTATCASGVEVER